jgi:predicted lipoprotein with Yx(FWY)xxD motif
MPRSRLISFLAGAAAIPLAAVVVAGCGSSSSSSSSGASASTAAPKTTSGAPATVGVASTGLGKILVDSQGRTVYLFKKDSGTKSACTGACAGAWPPVRANGKPTAGGGANASMVGTTARSDGAPQVTYNGHPVYTFTGDQKAGDTAGQGVTAFGAAWFALSPAGNQVSGTASKSGGSTSTSGGSTSSSGGSGGYGY